MATDMIKHLSSHAKELHAARLFKLPSSFLGNLHSLKERTVSKGTR